MMTPPRYEVLRDVLIPISPVHPDRFALGERLLVGDLDLFVVATGAGSSLQNLLWEIPGASAFLAGAQFPYAPHETDAFLGYRPSSYCSDETALALACEAFMRAKVCSYARSYNPRPAIGLAITASVASLVPHRGDHRIHVAVVSELGSWKTSYNLEKNVGPVARITDENVAALVGLDLLALVTQVKKPYLGHTPIADADIRQTIFTRPYFTATGRDVLKGHGNRVFFPGSFNPIHEAHREIACIAGLEQAIYMICVDHVHKPPLSPLDMLARAACHKAEFLPGPEHQKGIHRNCENGPVPALLFTEKDPLFVDKMLIRPNARWIMGADVLETMLDPQWGPSTIEVLKVIKETNSSLIIVPAKLGDRYITVRSVFEKYSIAQGWGDPVLIHQIEVELPGLTIMRSSIIRESKG